MQFDTIILGAGAAGLMCAAHAGGRVLLIDHAKAPGEKIRISGGGRCNFTNLYAGPENFLSRNPHFCKSALSRYTQWDFIELIDRHGIAWHEKTLGQLFCDGSAKQIVQMLRDMVAANGADLWLNTAIDQVQKTATGFDLTVTRDGRPQKLVCANLVIATGGKSIPKMGATGLAFDLARQFGHDIIEPHPGLVPLTFPEGRFSAISGVSLPVRARAQQGPEFQEALLFTHRGLSGPAILQISSYWRAGQSIVIDLLNGLDLFETLRARRNSDGRRNLTTVLGTLLPGRLVDHLARDIPMQGNLADQSDAALRDLANALADFRLTPNGSEGYRTAEVTLGGVNTDALSSKTMQSTQMPNLYFIGEAVDVTGWLGGFNFQWAWASAMAAARALG